MDDDQPSTDVAATTEAVSFEVPARPERRYTRSGGVEYEGETTFHLRPDPAVSLDELDSVLAEVLADGRYVSGDWFDLPRPVYLVHDREVSTAFRVVARSGRVELHVLPSTEADGLRALYDRLCEITDAEWSVDCRVDSP